MTPPPSPSALSPAPLSDEERGRVQAEVAIILPAVAERIHYAESRRTNFTVLAGGLVAAGVALLTLALGSAETNLSQFTTATAAVCSLGLGAALILLHNRQTNTYPWTSATKTWKWFYRDALPDNKALDFAWRDYFRQGKAKIRTKKQYDDQLPRFKSDMLRLRSNRVNLDQDLEQLYVLHINEKYKNLHLTHLRQLTSWGMIVLCVLTALSGAAGVYFDIRERSFHLDRSRFGPIKISTRWKSLHVGKDQRSEFILDVTAHNQSKANAALPRWAIYDENGLYVPIDSLGSGEEEILPGSKIRYTVLLRAKTRSNVDVKRIAPE